MKTKHVLISALGAAALSSTAHAEGGVLQVWPVPGLYGLDQTHCNRPAGTAARYDSAKIHPELCTLFSGPESLKTYGEYFAGLAQRSFTNTVKAPGADLGPGVPVSQRLSTTLIASLHLSRADIWSIDKSTGASDVFLPFTLTLNLTNAVSGEVMFTDTLSVIPSTTFATDRVFDGARRELPAQIRDAISKLVADAAAKFRPYPLTAIVRARSGENYVIDKGRQSGLRIGDGIGPDSRVVYAEAAYAVVRPAIGELKVGDPITRQSAAPAEYLAKPSIVIFPAAMPDGMSRAYLTQIFEEALGQQGVFSTVPVNQSFPKLRDLAISSAGMSSAVSSKRNLPDYAFHLDVFTLPPTEVETNIRGVRIVSYEAYAVGKVLDRAGRVVFSTIGSDLISDQVKDGVGFSSEQRRDTVARNALLKLAQRTAAEFKAQSFRLPVVEDGAAVVVDDAGGAVARGADGIVVRNGGRLSGIQGDVWLPVGNFEVLDVTGARAVLQSQEPSAPKVRRSDVFVFDGGGGGAKTRRSFSACATSASIDGQTTDLSEDPLVKSAGVGLLAGSYPAPVYLNDTAQLAAERLQFFPGWEKLGLASARKADLCFRPVLRIADQETVPDRSDGKAYKYNVIMGFTIHSGTEKLDGSGLRVPVTSGRYPANTSAVQAQRLNTREAISNFVKTVSGAVKQLHLPG